MNASKNESLRKNLGQLAVVGFAGGLRGENGGRAV
jgi:hypothetical protein